MTQQEKEVYLLLCGWYPYCNDMTGNIWWCKNGLDYFLKIDEALHVQETNVPTDR
jgi:hypothetical protein